MTEIQIPKDDIKRAIEWLGSEQPDDALISHHGITLTDPPAPFRSIGLCPKGADHYPVFVFNKKYST